jgi:hypothetical protein
MSVMDHFDKAPEIDFSRQWNAQSARRQFNVSLGLIAALSVAAGLLAFSMRPAAMVRAPSYVVQDSGPAFYGALTRP